MLLTETSKLVNAELKKKYRELLMKYHPDLGGDDLRKVQEINNAAEGGDETFRMYLARMNSSSSSYSSGETFRKKQEKKQEEKPEDPQIKVSKWMHESASSVPYIFKYEFKTSNTYAAKEMAKILVVYVDYKDYEKKILINVLDPTSKENLFVLIDKSYKNFVKDVDAAIKKEEEEKAAKEKTLSLEKDFKMFERWSMILAASIFKELGKVVSVIPSINKIDKHISISVVARVGTQVVQIVNIPNAEERYTKPMDYNILKELVIKILFS